MSAELYTIPCRLVEKRVLIGLDLALAFCQYQVECAEANRDCLFCRQEGSFPLEQSRETRHVERMIKMVRRNGGPIGLIAPAASKNKPNAGSDLVPAEFRKLLGRIESEGNDVPTGE
ncbi:MAG: hypothetical protein K8T25_15370 [Planctomycetia bacterium]|nr:hypothetical protein [Planctomycetia bacterium]